METEQEKQAHEELDKKIKICTCLPISHGEKYCEDCHDLVIAFMDKYGAGALTRDEMLEELKDEKESLIKVLGSKIIQLALLDEKYQKLKLKQKKDNK